MNVEFLTKKVGPLPMGVWLLLGVGGLAYLVYANRGKSSGGAPAAADATGSGTYTPAGDNATIGGGSSTSTDTGTSSGTSSGKTYADNQAWGIAAINTLVGLGYDAGVANQAITLYLSASKLTSQQQALVNIAVQRLGAPPELLPPVNGTVPPVVTPPSTGGTTTPPAGGGTTTKPPTTTAKKPATPTGLHAAATTTTSITMAWNPVPGATSYTLYDGTNHAVATKASFNHTRLKPGSAHHYQVTAHNSAGDSGKSAVVTVSTKKTASSAAAGFPKAYTVKAGDNLWNITKAAYGLKTNAQIQAAEAKVYAANKKIIGGNPNLIKPGQKLTLPKL